MVRGSASNRQVNATIPGNVPTVGRSSSAGLAKPSKPQGAIKKKRACVKPGKGPPKKVGLTPPSLPLHTGKAQGKRLLEKASPGPKLDEVSGLPPSSRKSRRVGQASGAGSAVASGRSATGPEATPVAARVTRNTPRVKGCTPTTGTEKGQGAIQSRKPFSSMSPATINSMQQVPTEFSPPDSPEIGYVDLSFEVNIISRLNFMI